MTYGYILSLNKEKGKGSNPLDMVKNANNSVYKTQRIMPLPIHGRVAVRQLMSVIALSSENEHNTVIVTTAF